MLASWVDVTAMCQPCCCRATMITEIATASKKGREMIR